MVRGCVCPEKLDLITPQVTADQNAFPPVAYSPVLNSQFVIVTHFFVLDASDKAQDQQAKSCDGMAPSMRSTEGPHQGNWSQENLV
jgi:hypothetical protein